MERELPTIAIHGTDFVVDVEHLLLREKDNPRNDIGLANMVETGGGYQFEYSPKSKNLPVFLEEGPAIVVNIPEFVQLDPIGMAQKYHCPIEEVKDKTDFDLMVNQEALKGRLSGRLTTVDIEGHTFYVDVPMDMLRPKDDFLSKGIPLSEIEYYFDEQKERYIIPYNPKTHEFQEPDYDRMTSLPKDLHLVSFPHISSLDPIGFNRSFGLPPLFGLKILNIQSHFTAGRVNWEDTAINNIIRTNIQKQQRQQQSVKVAQKATKRIRKGRGI